MKTECEAAAQLYVQIEGGEVRLLLSLLSLVLNVLYVLYSEIFENRVGAAAAVLPGGAATVVVLLFTKLR